MSTAGAQGVRFDSSPPRSSISPNTRLSCSCSVVAPREEGSQRFIALILSTSTKRLDLSWPRAIQITHVSSDCRLPLSVLNQHKSINLCCQVESYSIFYN